MMIIKNINNNLLFLIRMYGTMNFVLKRFDMFITFNVKTALRKLNFSKWPIIITLFFLNFGENKFW